MTNVRRRGIDVDLTELIKLLRNLEMTATLREHDCAFFETGARCEAIGESTNSVNGATNYRVDSNLPIAVFGFERPTHFPDKFYSNRHRDTG